MAHKSPLPHFPGHIPPAIVEVAIFVFSFVAIAALAGLVANLLPWS